MDVRQECWASQIRLKPEAADALRSLQQQGMRVVMLTGDNETTAAAVARKLGIADFEAGVLPDHKADVIKKLQQQGRIVAMAGDGVNDAPALAQAQVGVAMGTGTDVAMESAGITLLKGDLTALVRARRLSQAVMRNIKQNLFFAFVYNAIGVPIAAGILYPKFGLLLSPIIAAAAMSFSSVSVISNALALAKYEALGCFPVLGKSCVTLGTPPPPLIPRINELRPALIARSQKQMAYGHLIANK